MLKYAFKYYKKVPYYSLLLHITCLYVLILCLLAKDHIQEFRVVSFVKFGILFNFIITNHGLLHSYTRTQCLERQQIILYEITDLVKTSNLIIFLRKNPFCFKVVSIKRWTRIRGKKDE